MPSGERSPSRSDLSLSTLSSDSLTPAYKKEPKGSVRAEDAFSLSWGPGVGKIGAGGKIGASVRAIAEIKKHGTGSRGLGTCREDQKKCGSVGERRGSTAEIEQT